MQRPQRGGEQQHGRRELLFGSAFGLQQQLAAQVGERDAIGTASRRRQQQTMSSVGGASCGRGIEHRSSKSERLGRMSPRK